jgi:hypothetical protein
MTTRSAVLASLFLVALAGCDRQTGTMHVTIYGEDFIEDVIPAEVVSDRWSIDFSRFLVAVGEVDADGVTLPGSHVFDLTRDSGAQGHLVGVLEMPAGTVSYLGYRIGPATAAEPGNATPAR